MITLLTLSDMEVWRSYRERADCENHIKELKADFGLDSFALNDFWATEAALGFAMLAYVPLVDNLISLFRQAVYGRKCNLPCPLCTARSCQSGQAGITIPTTTRCRSLYRENGDRGSMAFGVRSDPPPPFLWLRKNV
jgi:hypothetical protein